MTVVSLALPPLPVPVLPPPLLPPPHAAAPISTASAPSATPERVSALRMEAPPEKCLGAVNLTRRHGAITLVKARPDRYRAPERETASEEHRGERAYLAEADPLVGPPRGGVEVVHVEAHH